MKKQLLTLSKNVSNSFEDTGKTAYNVLLELRAYNDFLDQPLTLSQFIPCDSEGKPMEPHRLHKEWAQGMEITYQDTKEQENAFRNLFEMLEVIFGELKLSGHNDHNKAKECPGFNMRDKFGDLINR